MSRPLTLDPWDKATRRQCYCYCSPPSIHSAISAYGLLNNELDVLLHVSPDIMTPMTPLGIGKSNDVQGDTSRWSKPPVNTKTEAAI